MSPKGPASGWPIRQDVMAEPQVRDRGVRQVQATGWSSIRSPNRSGDSILARALRPGQEFSLREIAADLGVELHSRT